QTGWWQSVAAGDFNGDGKLDLIAGNWGLNSSYHASADWPARFYYGDFDDNGTVDIIEAEDDSETKKIMPRRTKLVLGSAMPFVQAAYPTHKAYAVASVADILGDRMKRAREVTVNTLSTMLWLNRGDHFEATPLPVEAQFTPVSGISVADLDGDGNQDIFLAQNQFAQRGEDPRQDAGRGLWLRGDGHGRFKAMPGEESGVKVHGEQRGSVAGDFDEDGRADLVVTQNGAATKVYHNTRAKAGLRVRLAGPPGNPDGVGATVRAARGESFGPATEIHAGAGYWSQDTSVLVFAGATPTEIQVRWPGGKTVTAKIPAGMAEISINEEGGVKVIR
ncbi:MAG TPA: ASPIC/UnbV domain-containing protein, partial [Verrucomicrobiae bacterium]|nr:ASPIC/UnbV domain-containing protein [Verrucomicrobiae bacterium]